MTEVPQDDGPAKLRLDTVLSAYVFYSHGFK